MTLQVPRVLVVIATVMVVTVAACGGAAATPRPTSAPAATAVPAANGNDAMTAMARDNVDVVYCGDAPTPDWCAILHRVDGTPDLIVDGTSLFVATTAPDGAAARALGDKMCHAIAAASFDDNSKPIGFRHVHVQSLDPNVLLADCDVPD